MIKSKAILEVKIGERIYEFECPNDCPLGEVHDALVRMRSIVVQMMQAAQQQDELKKEEVKDANAGTT